MPAAQKILSIFCKISVSENLEFSRNFLARIWVFFSKYFKPKFSEIYWNLQIYEKTPFFDVLFFLKVQK